MRIPRDWFGPREELVPFGPQVSDVESPERLPRSPTRVEGGAAVDPNSFWDEGSSSLQGVVDAAPEDTEGFGGATSAAGHAARWAWRPAGFYALRPGSGLIAGIVAAAAVAVACVGALGLLAGHRDVGRAAGRSGEYASVASNDSIDARMVERPRLWRSASESHPRRSTRKTHRSFSPVVSSNSAQGEPVSYHAAALVNQVAASSGESASYDTQPAAPSPPQRSSATSASASDRSNSSSAPQPAHPSPTGALTCISNCG